MYGDDGRSGSIVYDGYIDQCMELIVLYDEYTDQCMGADGRSEVLCMMGGC